MKKIIALRTGKDYLGFTDGIKEPRKTRVEIILDEQKRYFEDGKAIGVFSRKELVLNLLLEGNQAGKEENYQTYKRDGELTKPKTVYRMYCDENSFYYITKTEYDFYNYLAENNLDTAEQINARIEADNEAERIKQEEIKNAKLKEKEEKIKAQLEKERVQAFINSEMEKVSQEDIDFVNQIYIDMYGEALDRTAKRIIVLVNNFDYEKIRKEALEVLHNGNSATCKAFEYLTGLKLPRTNKERGAFIMQLSTEDFQGRKGFKPRKKAEEKELKTYYIAELNTEMDEWKWKEVQAQTYTYKGIELFIMKRGDRWTISEARTGFLMASGSKSLKIAKNNVKEIFNREGTEKIKKIIEKNVEAITEKIGINPLFKEENA